MNEKIQSRLLGLAAVFLVTFAVILSLSPAVRERTWNVSYRWEHWIGVAAWLIISLFIHFQTKKHIPESDQFILPVAFLLSGWGILSISRLAPDFGLRQSAWLLVSAVTTYLIIRSPQLLNVIRKYKYLLLTGGILLTSATLLLGTNPAGFGPRLWLGCCGIYLQPSEPLKLLLIAYLASYLADRAGVGIGFIPLVLPTTILSGLALLILVVQRDMGTASIFIFLYAGMLYMASGQKRVLVASLILLIIAGLTGYYFIDIIQLRLEAWINPWADPSGKAYQIIQSILAVANGGIVGRGPGMGSPTVVPVAISDFIFAALAEENGLLGTFSLYTLLAIFVSRGFLIALRAPDNFRRLLAGGLTLYIGGQSLLIIGGNIRLLPITGVTLPFVSYGGSSLVTSFVAAVILLIISHHPEEEPAPIFNQKPYSFMFLVIMIGLGTVVLANSWWALYRGPTLLARSDNPRRSIADRYVLRGSLLDRSNQPITITQGITGSYIRTYLYPELGSVTGYTHPIYGQAGLEASLDNYLRGLQGNPASQIWWNQLVYGQPPEGIDIRLSINLGLQERADRLMGNHPGAIVLLNAQTGEILAMASHPTFDPNRLEEEGELLAIDPRAPLLNRAALGRYPAGTALAPFILAATINRDLGFELPNDLSLVVDGTRIECTRPPELPGNLNNAISSGCPAAINYLGELLTDTELINIFSALGLYSEPALRIQVSPASPIPDPGTDIKLALGQNLTLNPIQMALAAATLSNNGLRPPPRLAMAVNTSQQGWIVLPPLTNQVHVYSPVYTEATTLALSTNGQPYWQSLGQGQREASTVTWYLGGTPHGWQGTPLVVVVLLEENNPSLAMHIGQLLLNAAQAP